jgi:hypothetical protein
MEQGQSVPITTSGFTKEQYKRQMLDLDAKPQQGMIFHSAGQDSWNREFSTFRILQGPFDQFLRRAARRRRTQ